MRFPLWFEAAYPVPNANHRVWLPSVMGFLLRGLIGAASHAFFDHLGPGDVVWRVSWEVGSVQARQTKGLPNLNSFRAKETVTSSWSRNDGNLGKPLTTYH